jgi:hypothetical protein
MNKQPYETFTTKYKLIQYSSKYQNTLKKLSILQKLIFLFLFILLFPIVILIFLFLFIYFSLYSCYYSTAIKNDSFAQQTSEQFIKPSIEGNFIQNKQQLWVHQKNYLPTNIKSIVFLCHGYGEHCSRNGYLNLFQKMNEQGIAVFTLDHIGHGKSTGIRAYTTDMQILVDDIIAYAQSIQQYIGVPRFIMGHSMG